MLLQTEQSTPRSGNPWKSSLIRAGLLFKKQFALTPAIIGVIYIHHFVTVMMIRHCCAVKLTLCLPMLSVDNH